MGINVEATGTGVSVVRVGLGDDGDIFGCHFHAIIGCDPVFGGGVAVSKEARRKTRDGVVIVGDPVALAGALSSKVGCESLVSNAGTGVGELRRSISKKSKIRCICRSLAYKIKLIAQIPECASGNSSYGGTGTMAREDEAGVGVLGGSFFDHLGQSLADGEPRLPESLVDTALVAEVGVNSREVEVGDPRLGRRGSAER